MKKIAKIIPLVAAITFSSCNKNFDQKTIIDYNPNNEKDLFISSTTQNIKNCMLSSDTADFSIEEKKLEEKRQKNYHEEYVNELSLIYGDKLYTNKELLCSTFVPNQEPFYEYSLKQNPNDTNYYKSPKIIFRLTPPLRLFQYFLRNGKEETFKVAEQLGCKHHETILTSKDPIVSIFRDAGINIEGEKLNWIEVPNGRSGGTYRDGEKYGGNTEIIMTVKQYNENLDNYIGKPAKNAGYKISFKAKFQSVIANELSYEIQAKYFKTLFSENNLEILSEPFISFMIEIPNLQFQNNAQVAEFLSDVADWNTGGKYGVTYRFFNPLFYMSEKSSFGGGKKDRYWYSYQVQKYAMEQVLKGKGYDNYKKIVHDLIEQANNSNYENHDSVFISARKYFVEEDFEKIAQIYRRIGVQLLKKMKPYFKKQN